MPALVPLAADGYDDPGRLEPSGRPRLLAVGDDDSRGDGAVRLRVLLVEDDASMRMLCRFNLEASGFEVVSAVSGAEGIERAQSGGFDLILLDVMLPDLGGFEVARRLQSGETAAPIIFVSARGSKEDVERGRAAGAIDYVVKPFDPVRLPDRLREDLGELRRSGVEGVWRLRAARGS